MFQIDIDFEHLHQGKNNILFEKWDNFVEKIIPLMRSKIKDSNSKDLLERMIKASHTDIGSLIYFILYIVFKFCIPI